MLSINNNTSAAKVANTLTSHYGRLQTSTQRLSSGLRINGAADDAAGLAIRELMRADIAAYRQGMRNTNDAISMIQTFDGALGIIDEKLIRMKELAEQAATGTYSSTQRLMIDSEFQAMGEEIDRIARATDFNGIKLIDGVGVEDNYPATAAKARANAGIATLAEVVDNGRKYQITGGQGTFVNAQPASDAYQNGKWWDLSGITHPGALREGDITVTVANDGAVKFGDHYLLVTPQDLNSFPPNAELSIEYKGGSGPDAWVVSLDGHVPTSCIGGDSTCTFIIDHRTYLINVYDPQTKNFASLPGPIQTTTWTTPPNHHTFSSSAGTVTASMNGTQLSMTIDLGGGNSISHSWTIDPGTGLAVTEATVTFSIKDVTQPVNPNPPGPNTPGTDPNNPNNPNGVAGGNGSGGLPDLFADKVKIHFGPGNDSAEDYYYINKHDATRRGLGLGGVAIQTQEDAQQALVTIDDAIGRKDQIRAEYGAMQNRLENTLANISVQAENLQAAESRISDTDVALEMMNFVRNQILTQSAVAMLSQANSMPQMIMSLVR